MNQDGIVVAVARGGVGDHRTAVGVTDQHDRPRDAPEDACDVVGVNLHAPQRVRGRDDRVALSEQPGDDAVPAGGLRKGAVDEYDRWGALDVGGCHLVWHSVHSSVMGCVRRFVGALTS